ncbi:Non-specific serine/threonine protein kinase [Bertholletia excelsa]
MDSISMTSGSLPSSNDETSRVKFLCSFSGSILPRPQDGKLRYVGGETRIVSVARDITYDELMVKMRELYEGASVLKYQQPDEDLDALVSVVNDDDVTNMMEEYDKLGSGDGFTRLRIFLFSHPDQDGSTHFVDGDERDTERRYVDALNSLNESSEFRKQLACESVATGTVDDTHIAEQYVNQIALESGIHNQRNYELPIAQFNLRHLTIPHIGSPQPQQMEGTWGPSYYSPRHHGNHDPRPASDFPTSPSSGRYHSPYGEFSDKNMDRVAEEYNRQQVNPQSPFDHQPQFSDNVVWYPTGHIAGDKSGFPGNILHGANMFEGSSICEQCRVTFQRNQGYADFPWKHGEQPHLEQPNMANGYNQVASPCAECHPSRETFMLNTDAKFHPGLHPREPSDPRLIYNEGHNHERGWMLQPPTNPRTEEPRAHIPGTGRVNDHFIVDGAAVNVPIAPSTVSEGHNMPPNYVHHEDPRYLRPGSEFGNEVFHDHVLASGSHIHHIPPDERGGRFGNMPYSFGADNVYQASHGHAPMHNLWRHAHHHLQGTSSYEISASSPQANSTINAGFVRGTFEGSPRLGIGAENQNLWIESSPKMVGFDGPPVPGNSYCPALKLTPQAYNQGTQCPLTAENSELKNDAYVTESAMMKEKGSNAEGKELNHGGRVEKLNIMSTTAPEITENQNELAPPEFIYSNGLRPTQNGCGIARPDENGTNAALEDKELSDRLRFLPELIASVKKAALGVENVKTKVEEDDDSITVHDATAKGEAGNESEPVDVHGDVELDSDSDNPKNSVIEPTKAEEEAIARGLQTIKNDDLEEIRELGSGTYGAVYHGKWRGSDVAIKRIKASCFAGRPSERERLIADFWKEALILSSLHHPNVVSFYGIVRDGPDGSLATVTEFMVNGSLKQFLQKKDRTIDRRKRLIIAMDAAFGMEYLHGKNIVHFDLKCENLLVNMRDPHRPVCKIGDLGLSKVKQHTLVSGGVRGTLPWMAPELLSGKSNMVTDKIDVYSFGIVMWELLTGDEPYADMHCASIIGGIVNNTLRPKIPTWCDPEWKSLMESCWSSDPQERPSFSEISQKLRNMAAAMNVK